METTEIIDTVATTVENACQMGEPIPEWPDYNVADYFLNGGVGPMTVITLFLIAVLVSAWKAPTWVRDFGFGAVIASLCWLFVGCIQMFQAIEIVGNTMPFSVYCGGLWRILIPLVYGLLIYLLSIIISTFQKPRI